MPQKFTIKKYQTDGYYYVYNHAVDTKKLFKKDQDYKTFITFLEEYLTPKDTEALTKHIHNPGLHYKLRREAVRLLKRKNYADGI